MGGVTSLWGSHIFQQALRSRGLEVEEGLLSFQERVRAEATQVRRAASRVLSLTLWREAATPLHAGAWGASHGPVTSGNSGNLSEPGSIYQRRPR